MKHIQTTVRILLCGAFCITLSGAIFFTPSAPTTPGDDGMGLMMGRGLTVKSGLLNEITDFDIVGNGNIIKADMNDEMMSVLHFGGQTITRPMGLRGMVTTTGRTGNFVTTEPYRQVIGDRSLHFGDLSKSSEHIEKEITYPNITEFFLRLQSSHYDPRVRPYTSARPVNVKCSIFITSLSGISESDMDYTLDFYFRQTWTDYRLGWDVSHDEDAIEESITISGDHFSALWRPDTFFVNEKTASFHKVTGLNSFIRIMPDGHVTQSVRLTIRASCKMHFRFFPLDHQRCPLFIESYSLPNTDINYKWIRRRDDPSQINRDAAGFSPESTHLLHFVIHGYRTLETWSLREDGRNHSRLLFEIYLERNLGYYLIQIYVPASLIVVISWISFWIPRNSAPARVTLGVTTVLTMVTFTSMGAKAGLPNISYLKAMDLYLLTSFLMVFVALIEYAVVSYAEKQANKSSTVNRLARLFSTRQSTSLNISAGDDNRSRLDSLTRKRQSIMVFTDDERMTCECSIAPSLPSQIEWASRFGFPTVFVIFNCLYWAYFLTNRQDDKSVDAGFVDFNKD